MQHCTERVHPHLFTRYRWELFASLCEWHWTLARTGCGRGIVHTQHIQLKHNYMTLYTNQYYRGRDKVLRRTRQIPNASQEFPAALRGSTLVSRRSSSSLCSLTSSALVLCVITFFELIFMVFEDIEHTRILEHVQNPCKINVSKCC